ncbi:MAG: integrase [Verrucomicrobiota bacterium]
MQRNASQSNPQVALPDSSIVHIRGQREAHYQRVYDERKRPIRSLWVRNGRYYAQMTLEDEHTGQKQVRRVPLEGATTSAQARQKIEELRVERRTGKLLILKQTPKFSDFADAYIEFYKQAKDAKRASTLETEQYAINQWKTHLGQIRLDKIKRTHIDQFIAARQKTGMSARTVNLEVTILRNVMNRAIDEKWILHLPTENLRPLKSKPRKRHLFPREDMDNLFSVCLKPIFASGGLANEGEKGQALLNGQEFSDYLKLLCFSGARMSEALRLRWLDLDWNNGQLTIGSDGEVKNRRWRVVDFNPELEKHLKDMHSRRPPDSTWLFPSPRRGKEDRPARTFRESLLLARKAANIPTIGFHDCRHFFISMCVMSGIDFMTIARWVGHQDGGILIGKVYGHLSNEHAKRQAQKLDFDPEATADAGNQALRNPSQLPS